MRYPRVLVISNNPFSCTTNNGKTLASFFDRFPDSCLAQLYFSPEWPDSDICRNYFRLTDMDVLRCILTGRRACGAIVPRSALARDGAPHGGQGALIRIFKQCDVARLAREIIWLSGRWKSEQLDEWLKGFSPEIVFFCAGDSGFAYDIANYVRTNYGARLIVYITDDYVLPRDTLSPFWWLRRNYILSKMRRTVQTSDLFVTISEKMRNEYRRLLGRDSITAVNMTESLRDTFIAREHKDKDILTLVYAGGLHHKRYRTLRLLAQSLREYNNDPLNRRKARLWIYCSRDPGRRIRRYLNVPGASEIRGQLGPDELREVLNSSDILVHVESFEKRDVEATRLSISTKIPEYLSVGKPILSIGPRQIASMEYLQNSAFCITDPKEILSGLRELLGNEELRSKLSAMALKHYEQNHKKEVVVSRLMSYLVALHEEK